MVLLEKIWDDIVERSDTNCRLAGLRRTINTPPLIITDARGATTTGKCKRTMSLPGCSAAIIKSPTEPVVCKDSSVWASVFFPDVEKEKQFSAASGCTFFNQTQPYTAGREEGKGKQSLVT